VNRSSRARVELQVHARRYLVLVLAAGALAAVGCGGGPSRQAQPEGRGASDERFDRAGWRTDFSRHSVALSEFASGGPSRDGIAPIDRPRFEAPAQAARWLEAREPVLVVEVEERARAYPHQILIWHEIVNDTLAGRPIAVTYCPLCNSGVVFDRRVRGRTLRLGTTGNLRGSDLVMWDDATESWWQQFTGEAVVGELTGARLRAIPSQTLGFAEFRSQHPRGEVLSRNTGHHRDYGRNPYERYDQPDDEPFLLDRKADRRLPPKERVVAIIRGRSAAVVPFSRLARDPVVEVEIAGERLVVLFAPGVRSALDAPTIRDSRDVGTAAAFSRELDGRLLGLVRSRSGRFRDRQTGSEWSVAGRAVAGPLRDRRLTAAVHDLSFWFAVAAFRPNARILRR
jgi:hypothetical protein